MIEHLGSYPRYKDTGIPWLGEVPDHWDVKRNKLILREVDERSEHGSEDLLSVSQYTGVTRRRERLADGGGLLTNAASLVGYKRVTPGDLVMNIMLAWNGSLGVSPVEGIVSPAYCVFRATTGLEPHFLHYLFRTPLFTGVFKTVSTGVVDSRLRLYPDVFFRLTTPLPPLGEQVAIVRFLDHADRRIRRYIAAKKKLIALLTEQKQAIIHGAVTRGVDPNVRLKPSGVEWLGDVPEHWEVSRLRHLIRGRLTYGANAAAEYSNPDWPRYLRITDFAPGGALRAETFRSLPPDIAVDYMVVPGDILFARSGATVGKAFLVAANTGVACHAGYLIRARPNPSVIDPEFLFAYTQSAAFARWRDSTFIIATIQNIGADRYADLRVPVPPLSEQLTIVRFLGEATAGVDTAIRHAQTEIELLSEFRTRLIADVVTGKLDVREAAAQLPDEEEAPEPLDDAEDVMGVDESEAEADFDTAIEVGVA